MSWRHENLNQSNECSDNEAPKIILVEEGSSLISKLHLPNYLRDSQYADANLVRKRKPRKEKKQVKQKQLGKKETLEVHTKDLKQIRGRIKKQSHRRFGKPQTKNANFVPCVYDDIDRQLFLMDRYPEFRRVLDAETCDLEFGGNIGSLILIILMPSCIFYTLLCKTNKCDFKDLMEDKMILCMKVIAQLLFIQIVIHGSGMFGPSYRNKHDPQIVSCFNGTFAVAITFTILLIVDHLRFLLIAEIMEAYVEMATMSFVAAIILTIFLHFKCHTTIDENLNVYAESPGMIYNFWRGKEIFPTIGNINMKMVLYRYAIVASMVLLLIHLKSAISWDTPEEATQNFTELFGGIFIQPTIVIIALMQICYIGFNLVNEEAIVYTFEWNYEGMGYMEVVKCFMYPFFFTSLTKHAADNDIVFWKSILIFLLAIFVIGFSFKIWYRSSKCNLRINPVHPGLKDKAVADYVSKSKWLKTCPTSVRHPNHLGDFIIQLLFGLTALMMLSLAIFPAVVTAACIAHRAWRIDRRCYIKYRTPWNLYCIKHPMLIFSDRW